MTMLPCRSEDKTSSNRPGSTTVLTASADRWVWNICPPGDPSKQLMRRLRSYCTSSDAARTPLATATSAAADSDKDALFRSTNWKGSGFPLLFGSDSTYSNTSSLPLLDDGNSLFVCIPLPSFQRRTSRTSGGGCWLVGEAADSGWDVVALPLLRLAVFKLLKVDAGTCCLPMYGLAAAKYPKRSCPFAASPSAGAGRAGSSMASIFLARSSAADAPSTSF
mmetsp:Transcript_44066/g.102932  ORF Transcript_44066/g.102932 Transcript_44066/m.102932 type:complete len:221 (-) Transcript_44066:1130-1792(-)